MMSSFVIHFVPTKNFELDSSWGSKVNSKFYHFCQIIFKTKDYKKFFELFFLVKEDLFDSSNFDLRSSCSQLY